MNELGLLVSVPTYKKLRIHHSILQQKKLNNLKINDFCWTHQRTEVSGKIITSKLDRRTIQEERDQIYLSEVTGAIN